MQTFHDMFAAAGLVPDCGGGPCGWADLLVLANNLVKFMFEFGSIIAALVVAYAGWLYLTSGDNAGKRSQARSALLKVVIGFIIMLSSYLIVTLILKTLGYQPPPGGGPGIIELGR